MKKCKAIIFDLDGTLLDTLQDLAEATNAALTMNGFPRRSIDEVRRFVGNGVANLIVRAMPGGSETDTVEMIRDDNTRALHAKVLKDFKTYYNEHCEDHTSPYDGVIDMLRRVKNNGIKTAVVSNKSDFAVQKLCKDTFGDLIDVARGENEAAGISKKPAPDMVYAALRELGIEAKDAVYIGDSDVDILTAKAAGMPCISACWGFRSREFLLEHGAKTLIDDPGEVC